MGGMPMPGGWTMTMTWMRMPGQTWPGAALSFLAMWVVMMVAMMLPSLIPMLCRYRDAVGRTDRARLALLTALVGAAYFFVWTVIGAAVYPTGAALAALEMEQPAISRAVPLAVCATVLIAGALQFTAWKAHHLACCRETPDPGRALPADTGSAWRYGLRIGLHCSCSCAGLTAILLAAGVMDFRVMALVTAAITIEHLAPAGQRVARAIGAVVIAVGLLLLFISALGSPRTTPSTAHRESRPAAFHARVVGFVLDRHTVARPEETRPRDFLRRSSPGRRSAIVRGT